MDPLAQNPFTIDVAEAVIHFSIAGATP